MLEQLVPLLLKVTTRDIGASARQAGRDGLLYAAMAVLGLTGFGLAVAGGILWLVPVLGPGPAFMLVAAAVLLPVAGILLLMSVWRRAERKRQEQAASADLLHIALTLLPLLMRSPAAIVMAAAGLAAFLLIWDVDAAETPSSPDHPMPRA